MLRFFALSFLSCLPVATLAAQSFTGTILGTIRDASGGVVPQARVSARNAGANATAESISNADGGYAIPLLPVGNYVLEIEANGFRPYRQEGIRLTPGNRIPANRFDVVARNVLRYWPEANQPGLAATRQDNFYNSGSAKVDTDSFDLRLDHNVTPRLRTPLLPPFLRWSAATVSL